MTSFPFRPSTTIIIAFLGFLLATIVPTNQAFIISHHLTTTGRCRNNSEYYRSCSWLPFILRAHGISSSSSSPSTEIFEPESKSIPRRDFLSSQTLFWAASGVSCWSSVRVAAWAASYPPIDVNNAMTREFTAYPGLYPTIGTKIVNAAKAKPFASKKDVYAALGSDAERERLRLYDSSIRVQQVDKALQQFKGSQICKYECGSRVSGSFRDEQIRDVQNARR